MKKNLLTVLILALLIVNIVLTSVMMFSMMSTNKKTAELVTNIATVLNLELTPPGAEGVVEQVSLADTAVHNMTNSLTLLLKSGEDGKTRYLMCDVALSMNMKHEDYETYGATIAEKEKLIEDAIGTVIANHTAEEYQQDPESIKAEVLNAIQDLFQSDFVYNVAISNVKIG